jgi:putative membrane protein
MMWWYGSGMGGWGYTLMTVSMVLFWGLVIYGVIAMVRYLGRQDRSVAAVRPTAEQVLAERFAHGQIDVQELPGAAGRAARRAPTARQTLTSFGGGIGQGTP